MGGVRPRGEIDRLGLCVRALATVATCRQSQDAAPDVSGQPRPQIDQPGQIGVRGSRRVAPVLHLFCCAFRCAFGDRVRFPTGNRRPFKSCPRYFVSLLASRNIQDGRETRGPSGDTKRPPSSDGGLFAFYRQFWQPFRASRCVSKSPFHLAARLTVAPAAPETLGCLCVSQLLG